MARKGCKTVVITIKLCVGKDDHECDCDSDLDINCDDYSDKDADPNGCDFTMRLDSDV